MSDIAKKLKAVEYTRPYQAEKLSRIQLVGESRWIRDIELLLEDEWKSLKRYPDAVEAFQHISSELPHLALVEPKAYSEDTFKWIEHCIQNGVKTNLIGRQSENMFEWMSSTRRAAALDVGGILFSDDAKKAASELTEFLENSEALKSTSRINEIQYIRTAFQGYQCASNSGVAESSNELFALLSDEFALPSETLAMTAILLETISLWQKPKAVDSQVHLAYKRIEREIQGTQAKDLLEISISCSSRFANGNFSEEKWNELVDGSSLGLLSKRRLKKKFEEAKNVLEFSSGVRTLRIA